MLSPLAARTNVPASSAAIPDPVATPSTAFSREAKRYSSTDVASVRTASRRCRRHSAYRLGRGVGVLKDVRRGLIDGRRACPCGRVRLLLAGVDTARPESVVVGHVRVITRAI